MAIKLEAVGGYDGGGDSLTEDSGEFGEGGFV